MLLKRWEPFGDIRRAESDLDRFWPRAFPRTYFRRPVASYFGPVAVDVYEEGDNLVVRATLPGVKPEDVDASIMDNTLTIEAKSALEEEAKENEYLHREHRFGKFRRVVRLPKGLNTDEAEAAYENGVLTVRVPREKDAKKRSLEINVNALEGSKS
ncbi:MAG: Hsp20/alpha crystallin family protein [Dehalococcoidia bacterium]|nr:Hsp20/alpha crystallin family protein [Dehalococcoidia bacterium]